MRSRSYSISIFDQKGNAIQFYMKKFYYLVLSAAMLLGSCSNEEPSVNSGNKADALVTNYLTVNVVPTYSGGTRAEGDNLQGDGVYRDGSASEQQVNSIRFFFFDEDGYATPVNVVSGPNETETNVSYIDWIHYDSDLGPGNNQETVEATLTATLGLMIPDGVDEPVSMIAIINPSDEVKALTGNAYGPSMSTVQQATANYQSGLTESNFVMSNSVYAASKNSETYAVNYTSLIPEDDQPSYFQSSIEAAQANPVIVYVERVVARLDLAIGIDTENAKSANGYTLYPVMKKVEDGEDMQVSITINGVVTPVYVQFLGWNVTSTPEVSYLVKMINPSWQTNALFGAANPIWNSTEYHRSFWAMNPALTEDDYRYGNFGNPSGAGVEDNYQPARALPIPAAGKYSSTYMQENASPYSSTLTAAAPSNPTQVILAAQLVDQFGTPIKLAEWGYKKYTQDDLLTYLVTNIISKGNFYKKVAADDYVSLQPGDLKFISAMQKYPNGLPANVERYYSYVVLNSPDTSTDWYIKTGTSETPTDADFTQTTVQNINDYILQNVNYTLMWDSGYTYYYFDVRHLGQVNSFGYHGIVRNHIYEATVRNLYGYGTPVCNPDEIIIPQAPEYEEILLSAEIRILQWRVVSASYDLDWR